MRNLNILFLVLLIVGGLNWGLVGLADFDLVAAITGAGDFGAKNTLGVIIYALVGIAAVYWLFNLRRVAVRHKA